MNSDLLFEGKTYISCKRAAKLSGYVNDYIGQLCRDGKLECRMVGRSWYVSLESLIFHKNSFITGTKCKPSQIYRNTSLLSPLPEYLVSNQIVAPRDPKVDTEIYPVSIRKISEPEALPSISMVAGGAAPVPVVGSTLHGVIISRNIFSKVAGFAVALVIASLSFQSMLAIHPEVKVVYQNIGTEVFENVSTLATRSKSISLTPPLQYSKASVIESINSFPFKLARIWNTTQQKILALFRTKQPEDSRDGSTIVASRAGQGVVVVPVRENVNNDEAIAKVRSTFSDEVQVNPYDDGSGVITPVFRESKGDDYLYVLVPIPN